MQKQSHKLKIEKEEEVDRILAHNSFQKWNIYDRTCHIFFVLLAETFI